MLRRYQSLLALCLVLGPVPSHAEDNWAQLKLGMTAEDAVAALGRPMLRARGRGFETWTYDNGAEVLLYGSLVGWTAPGTANVVARSMDVWRVNRTGTYFPTFLALLPPPAVKSPAPARDTGSSGHGGPRSTSGSYWLPVYRRR